MKKAFLGLITAALLVSPLGLAAAHAAPTAPRAKAAPQAIEAPPPGLFCLPDIDRDTRILCVADRPEGDCRLKAELLILSYWKCGDPQPRPPTPAGCLNIDGDRNFLCLFGAKPAGTCTVNFEILIVHDYHCSAGGGRRLPL